MQNDYSMKDKDLNRNAIMEMCGCYEVEFNYAETFSPLKDYKRQNNYHEQVREWSFPLLDEENKISIQHLLIVNNRAVIKHWREDWVYEDQERYDFDKNNRWKFVKVAEDEVSGQWTQKVFQVDDSPRYSGSASWNHSDGRSFWENLSHAPMPRREYKDNNREDYNALRRFNRIEIEDFGWVHHQDNEKIIRKDNQVDQLVAEEKGVNNYKKVADSACKVAQEWWETHKEFWARVREVWQGIYNRNQDLKLEATVDDKPLFQHLFSMSPETPKEEIENIMYKFVAN